MKLSLIAMSGSGKSYWSAKLAKRGFRHFDCDQMIAARTGTHESPAKWIWLQTAELEFFPSSIV